MKTYQEITEIIEKMGFRVYGDAGCPNIYYVKLPIEFLFNYTDLSNLTKKEIIRIMLSNSMLSEPIVGKIDWEVKNDY